MALRNQLSSQTHAPCVEFITAVQAMVAQNLKSQQIDFHLEWISDSADSYHFQSDETSKAEAKRRKIKFETNLLAPGPRLSRAVNLFTATTIKQFF